MSADIVVMFCGPHEQGQVSFRRIDVAIRTALKQRTSLVIAGDGNFGRDLELFARRARCAGVMSVETLYDVRATTMADAQIVCEYIDTHPLCADTQTMYLVTDFWHMPRATLMLIFQMKKRFYELVCVPVATPHPTLEVLRAEQQGIQDLLSGQYGIRHDIAHFGKPAHPDSVTFSYTESVSV